MKRYGYPFVLTVVLLLCASCAPMLTATETSNGTPDDEYSIVACVSSPSANQMPLVYADRQGIFEKHGLAVELVTFNSGSTATAALIAGDVDICQVAGAPVLNAILAGEELVYVGSLFNRHIYAVVTRPEIASEADLPGSVFAISSPGGLPDALMRIAADYWGLEVDKDITLLSIGNQSERLVALETGSVDGTVLAIPGTTQAQALGYEIFLDLGELDLYYPSIAIATRRNFLAEERPAAQLFMQAIVESIAAMKSDRDTTIKVMADYLQLDTETEAALLDEAYDVLISKRLESEPYINTEGVSNLIELASQENPDASTIDPAMLIDHSLLDEIFAESTQR